MINKHALEDTAFTKDFHERILTIDDTSDLNEVNKIPVANEHGYLDKSWLQDYSSYKIKDLGTITDNYTVSLDETEYINVLTIGEPNLTIKLYGASKDEGAPYNRALVYRFLVFNPDNYTLTWSSNVTNSSIVWNTYSETAPVLDPNGSYLEFISTDKGLTWFGVSANMTNFDIHNYYNKLDSDNRFVHFADTELLVPDMTNNAGRYLTTNGAESYWVKYEKQIYVNYPTRDITTITVPSSYLTNAVITDIYRNGVLLTESDDYSKSNTSGVITFTDTIKSGEKIIVITETNVRAHSASSFDSVALTNSTADTPDTNDNSSKIATTAYVTNKLSGFSDTLAPINSPEFTGIPTAPTANAGTNNAQIATTAYADNAVVNATESITLDYTNAINISVTNAVNSIIDNAPSNLNTLKELAKAINNDPNYYNSVNTALDGKLNNNITIIGNGNAVASITESNNNLTINTIDFSLIDHNHDSDYTALTSNVGSSVTPIYTDSNGILTATTATIGDPITPIYMANGELTPITLSIGNSNTPVYIDEGSIRPFTQDIGDSDTPVYIDDGGFYSTGKHFSDYLLLTGGTITGSLNITDSINIGDEDHIEINSTSIQAKSGENTSDILINSDGGSVQLGNDTTGKVTINNGVVYADSFVGEMSGTSEMASKDSNGNVITTTYAPLVSPSLSGTPTAPTADAGDNSNQIATTSYVDSAIASLVSTAPNTLDTLNELAEALGNDPDFATTTTNLINSKVTAGSASYVKNASINGDIITIQYGDDSTSDLSLSATTYSAGSGITIDGEGVISAQRQLPLPSGNSGRFLIAYNGNTIWNTNVVQSDSLGFISFKDINIVGSNSIESTEENPTTEESYSMNLNSYAGSGNLIGSLSFSKDIDANGNITESASLNLNNKHIGLNSEYDAANEDLVIYSYAPTPIGNNNNEIATTGYVTNAINNVDALPSQTNNSGKFLTTNGSEASWIELDQNKVSSIHYPNENDTTITLTNDQSVPSNINKYAMSVYRDGVYLNPNIDYGFNHDTNTITFNKVFETDEIVTVIFNWLSNDGVAELDIDVEEYEAGTNITFTDNPITNKVTISANDSFSNWDKDYNDLINTPTNISTFANDSGYTTLNDVNNRLGIPIEKVTALTSSSSITINPANGSLFTLDLDTDTTITLSSIYNGYYTTNGALVTLLMPSNNYIVSWSNNVIWVSGSAPDLSSGYNIITFVTSNGGTTWYGNSLSVSS